MYLLCFSDAWLYAAVWSESRWLSSSVAASHCQALWSARNTTPRSAVSRRIFSEAVKFVIRAHPLIDVTFGLNASVVNQLSCPDEVKVKVRFVYIAPQLPHMLPQRRCRHGQSWRTAYATAQACGRWLWPASICIAIICRFHSLMHDF